ncbi:antibiotic biosynthesis monooxygenase family protein [Novosphingobium mathurense]|uniref:Heme-degrading monooxygenase HmoA n=1 Tax=Novosphingobium mathurense TaxID=428990 RepID=A0A1U6IAA8_9SPHN|nr:antibiotic biosynthesis monooxygenase [Novosphingobium mathurense]SLK04933.1 Heme-degrading monooxygenase HmoA [Novosphingobium mathurense]
MFIAMNRFQVIRGEEEGFETMWKSRESFLHEVSGFVAFYLLRGPEAEDHTLYATHTVWQSKAAFEGWTRSEAFCKAHAGAASAKPRYLGPPRFEGFEAIQTVNADGVVS